MPTFHNALLRALMLWMALLIGSVAPSVPIMAQSTANITLDRVSLIAEAADEAVFAVEFSPRPGSYSAVNADPLRPGLMLLRTRRATDMPATTSYRGLVSDVTFETTDSGLSMRFATRASGKVSVAANGARTLLVTVKRLTGAEAIGSRPVDSAGQEVATVRGTIPPAFDPMVGEDGYELVMLKYADVSEIVGLLSNGVSIKPNN
ncbi:MAG: hypothetical protein ABIR87_04500, partial [Sphingomicrobium sp.]